MESKTTAPQADQAGIWTPANIVTCVRIAFIPVFMVLAELSCVQAGAVYLQAPAIAAFALYVLLSLTDKLDGYLARSRGQITDFGKFLDPIADKLLVFSALLVLLEQGLVSVWFVFIILLREFLVSALRMVAGAKGGRGVRRGMDPHRGAGAHGRRGGSDGRLRYPVFLERPGRHLLVKGRTCPILKPGQSSVRASSSSAASRAG